MRFSAVLVGLSASLASAATLDFFGGSTAVSDDDDLKIPGDSPLELCPGNHDHDTVTIERVDLDPNPPKAGKDLVIKASGVVHEAIEKDAYVLLTVKYGLIRLISTTADLCEQVGNVDLECPVKPGPLEITKTVELPAEIPPGKYTVLADVYSADDVQITCLTATVQFSRGAGFFTNEL